MSKVGSWLCLALSACDFTFAARPAAYVDGRPAVVKEAELEVSTDGIVGPNSAKNVLAVLGLGNGGHRPVVIVEIDLVGVDGVAIAGSTQKANSARALDPEARTPGLEVLPLTLGPGASASVATRFRLDRELELTCADRCTLVVRFVAGNQPGELRVDLLDDTSRAAPAASSQR